MSLPLSNAMRGSPIETLTSSVEPGGSVTPLFCTWATTRPFGTVPLIASDWCTWTPAALAWASTSASLAPLKSGTFSPVGVWPPVSVEVVSVPEAVVSVPVASVPVASVLDVVSVPVVVGSAVSVPVVSVAVVSVASVPVVATVWKNSLIGLFWKTAVPCGGVSG